ncbi:MAG: VOC family protein [Dehalococcoidia bacterium]|nr:VOC family protein [Dehalococcoidia bacterium]
MIEKFEHIGIGVKDMEASVTFYRDVMGFQVFMEKEMPAGGPIKKLVFLRRGEDIIELLSFRSADAGVAKYESLGTSHICFAVQGIKAEIDRWVGLGIPQVIPTSPTADGGFRTAFKGPNGEFIELKGK